MEWGIGWGGGEKGVGVGGEWGIGWGGGEKGVGGGWRG